MTALRGGLVVRWGAIGVEESLVKAAITNGIWAALFVFLLVWVLRTSAKREDALIANNDKLIEANNRWAVQFGELSDVKEGVSRVERRLDLIAQTKGGGQ
jgi:hypothetical protein